MIGWPTTLPRAPYSAYKITSVDALSSAEDELSPQRKRTYPDHTGEFTFKMSSAQGQALRTFYNVDLNQGNSFTAPWLVPAGFPNHCMQFIGPPVLTFKTEYWEVAISVRIICLVPRTAGNISYGSGL